MSTFKLILTVYVLGGITFVPLLLGLILLTAYYTLPDVSKSPSLPSRPDDPANLVQQSDTAEQLVFKTATDDLAEKFLRKHDSDVAAGYFAVCRDYVPGGVNGKPPDRLSPAGEVVANESPSVYQSMYRSIFDRSQKPTIEPHKDGLAPDGGPKRVKRANNVFYVVLRHGHLMLYDDIQQLEVRYVISLEYHDVDIYSGDENDVIPEAELWIKRNAIRLRRRRNYIGDKNISLPFFFFSENLSEKEDFYFAMLKNQEKNGQNAPSLQEFDTRDIISLVQKLHSSEEQLETRWLNALAGRAFLAMYKTPFLEDVIRKKLTKKISRVKKPNFITKLALQKIDTGHSAPFITNPRLRDLTVNGDCIAEMDIEYNGQFRIEIAATARIDLGSRFKAREVDMVLAATCKKMTGRLLLKLKPPPSNRFWVSFEKMPKVEMALEPIVSTRQITYSVVLKAIESRIMEVIAESVVLPFWDDMPFLDTAGEQFRGGIWKKEPIPTKSTEIKDQDAEDEAEAGEEAKQVPIENLKKDERTLSMPVLSDSRNPTALHAAKKSVSSLREALASVGSDRSPKGHTPRIMRSTSFASVADPTLSPTHVGGATPILDMKDAQKRDNMLLDLSRSLSNSPNDSNVGSFPTESAMETAMRERASSNTSRTSIDKVEPKLDRHSTFDSQNTASSNAYSTTFSLSNTEPASSATSMRSRTSSVHDSHQPKSFADTAKSLTSGDRKQAITSINAAAAAAQKWGWGVINRNRQREAENGLSKDAASTSTQNPRLPMGRGQPLPPPGTPLPGPERPGIFSMPKRKPVLPHRNSNGEAQSEVDMEKDLPKPPALPDRPDRRRRQTSLQNAIDVDEDEILVVEAPTESNPSTPAGEHHDDFFGHGEGPDNDKAQNSELQSPPPLPIRQEDLDSASLDAVTGGSIDKATKEHEAAIAHGFDQA